MVETPARSVLTYNVTGAYSAIDRPVGAMQSDNFFLIKILSSGMRSIVDKM